MFVALLDFILVIRLEFTKLKNIKNHIIITNAYKVDL
jgi:hypothetical protein